MSTAASRDRLARILLGLLGPADRRPAPESLAGMDDDDWQQLLLMAHRHRLSPTLRRRLQSMPDAPIPENISATLKQDYRPILNIRKRGVSLSLYAPKLPLNTHPGARSNEDR